MYVKPKEPHMIVRDPRSYAALPPEGKRVPDNSYWLRRLKSGDVVETSAEEIAKGKSAAKAHAEIDAEARAAAEAEANPPKRRSSARKSRG